MKNNIRLYYRSLYLSFWPWNHLCIKQKKERPTKGSLLFA